MHHHHIQSPLSSKVYVNLILIKKWGQHPREYEYLKVKLRMQKWIKMKITKYVTNPFVQIKMNYLINEVVSKSETISYLRMKLIKLL